MTERIDPARQSSARRARGWGCWACSGCWVTPATWERRLTRPMPADEAVGCRPRFARARPPHFPAKAKHVIHIYLNGGPSQVDTFDPKPLLKRYEGKMLPQGNLTTERKTGTALPSPFRFQKYGQSGIEVSEIFARTARAHRRHLRDPLDAGQHAQSRAVDAADELRRRAAVAAEHGGLAHLRPGHAKTRTCPGSSRCARACRSPTSPTGARHSCPASTRGPTSTPGAARSRN